MAIQAIYKIAIYEWGVFFYGKRKRVDFAICPFFYVKNKILGYSLNF
jgi:hypothetical protein